MRHRSFLFQAIVYSLSANFLFASMWVCIKFLGARLPVTEVVFLRALSSLLFLLPILWWKKIPLRFGQIGALMTRSLCGYLSILFSFYAIAHISMGNTAALSNTTPIFVALLAPLLGQERFEKKHFFLILLAFTGVCLILKPDSAMFSNIAWMALAAGLFNALSVLSIRDLYRTNNSYTIVFFFTLTITLCAAPLGVQHFLFPTLQETLLLAVIGLIGAIAHIWLMKAYQHMDASIMSSIGYAFVLFCYLLEVLIWQALPDGLTLLGAALTMGAGIAILHRQRKRTALQALDSVITADAA